MDFSDFQHFYEVILSLKNQNSKTALISHYSFLPWKIYIFIYIQTKYLVRNECGFWVLIFQRQNHYIEMLRIWKNHWKWLFSTINKKFYAKHFFQNFSAYFVANIWKSDLPLSNWSLAILAKSPYQHSVLCDFDDESYF